MKYNAFISYSHSADTNLAPKLEHALEKFAKPTFKRKALNIFRDSNDLSASPNLWGKIEEGLAQAEYFIFMASPRAAQSKWCRKEVEYWKKNKPLENFLVVLTDGELVWNDTKSDFDWEKTNSIPNNLKGVFENEPLYANFKAGSENLTLEDPDFKSNVVLLAATLHGRSIGDMIGEGTRQHKRTIRIRNSAIGILSVLFIASILLAFFAFQQKAKAEKNEQIAIDNAEIAKEEKEKAIHQANRALAKSYLSDSRATLTTDATLSIRLAEYAYQFAKFEGLELQDFEDQLITSFYNNSDFYLANNEFSINKDTFPIIHEFEGQKLQMSEKGDTLYLVDQHHNYSPFDIPGLGQGWPLEFISCSFSPKGKFILIRSHLSFAHNGYTDELAVYNLDRQKLSTASSAFTSGVRDSYRPTVRFDSSETRFVIYGPEGASIFNSRYSNSEVHPLQDKVIEADISPDGNFVAFGLDNGIVQVYKLYNKNLIIEDEWQLSGHGLEPIESVAFSKNGKYLLSKSENCVRKWLIQNDIPPKYIMLEETPHIYSRWDSLTTVGDQGVLSIYGDAGDLKKVVYKDNLGDTIAIFHTPNHSVYSFPDKCSSKDERYYASLNGLFTKQGELLIRFDNLPSSYKKVHTCGFTEDSKYLFFIDKVFFLNPDLILSRLNNKDLFGEIAGFDTEAKEQYMIRDIE